MLSILYTKKPDASGSAVRCIATGNQTPQRYYLTFGATDHFFKGGWAIVYAYSPEQARLLFALTNQLYDYLEDQVFVKLCSNVYTETQWAETSFSKPGALNLGAGLQQTIMLFESRGAVTTDETIRMESEVSHG